MTVLWLILTLLIRGPISHTHTLLHPPCSLSLFPHSLPRSHLEACPHHFSERAGRHLSERAGSFKYHSIAPSLPHLHTHTPSLSLSVSSGQDDPANYSPWRLQRLAPNPDVKMGTVCSA